MGQLLIAFAAAMALRRISALMEDPATPLLGAALVSFVVPKRFGWLCLAAWAMFWLDWALWERELWQKDANKFGEGCYVYGFAAFIFALASWLRFRQINSKQGSLSRPDLKQA